jgi:hypothetical protein
LQRQIQIFEDENIPVYTLSYDEADALRDFRDAHNITYPLFSDPDSKVIESFGILNTLINEDDHPWYGIPYPGTYVIDADGTITHKFFDSNLAVRVGPEQLLSAALGKSVETTERIEAATGDQVAFKVWIEGENLTATVQRNLVAQFRVPKGKHVYADPAPEGTRAVNIELDSIEGLVPREVIRPTAEPHKLVGTDETFGVHHDNFALEIPLTVNNAAGDEITVSGKIVRQSCDDEVCDIPVHRSFKITLPVAASPAVALGSKKGAALEPNAMKHFVMMTERRVKQTDN